MTTVHRAPEDDETSPMACQLLGDAMRRRGQTYVAFTKGASDSVLDVSTSVLIDGVVEPMSDEYRSGSSSE